MTGTIEKQPVPVEVMDELARLIAIIARPSGATSYLEWQEAVVKAERMLRERGYETDLTS